MVKLKWATLTSLVSCLLSAIVFVGFLGQNNITQSKAQELFTADQIIIAVNTERQKSKLPVLTKNSKLTSAAQEKSKDMSRKNYFSHISPIDGKKWSDFIKESNYQYRSAGENLATGFTNIEPMVRAWMDSPSHRENILNTRFDETGVAISKTEKDGQMVIYVVQVFGRQI